MRRLPVFAIVFLIAALPTWAAAVEPRISGAWTMTDEEGSKVVLTIEPDGHYSKLVDGRSAETGKMQALDGKWTLNSDSGRQDSGTFSVVGGQLVFRGSMSAPTRWTKHTGAVSAGKPASTRPTATAPAVRAPVRSSGLSAKPVAASPYSKVSVPDGSSSTPRSSYNGNVSTVGAAAASNSSQPSSSFKRTPGFSAHYGASEVQHPGGGRHYVRYRRTGFQGMAPNKGWRVGTKMAFPGAGHGNPPNVASVAPGAAAITNAAKNWKGALKAGLAGLAAAAQRSVLENAGPVGNSSVATSPVSGSAGGIQPAVSNVVVQRSQQPFRTDALSGRGTYSAMRKAHEAQQLQNLPPNRPITVSPHSDETGMYGVSGLEQRAFGPPKVIRIHVY